MIKELKKDAGFVKQLNKINEIIKQMNENEKARELGNELLSAMIGRKEKA